MRGRNGNKNRSFALCSVILFYSLALNASEYLISYRYVVKDMKLLNESLQVSRAMKKCNGLKQNYIELPHQDNKNLSKIIDKNSKEFIDFIHRLGLDMEHKSLTNNAQYSATTILTLKTTCFKVDFNDYFARITPLK